MYYKIKRYIFFLYKKKKKKKEEKHIYNKKLIKNKIYEI